jgi:hypothetical protein
MSGKILAAIGATVFGALTVLGISAASPGTAHASTTAAVTNAAVTNEADCEDGFTLLMMYTLMGDTATADALAQNLAAMGCMI